MKLTLRQLSIGLLIIGTLCFSLPAYAVNIEKVVSKSGIEAWLIQDHSNSIIDLELSFKSGSAADPIDKFGLAALTAGLLNEGAGPYQGQSLATKLQNDAIELSFEADHDFLHGHLKTLTQNRDEAFHLLSLTLTQPLFEAPAVTVVKEQVLSILASQKESPPQQAIQAWFKQAFGTHPYAHNVYGSAESIKGIQSNDLHHFVKQAFARDNVIIGVVGDITPNQLRSLLDDTFGALPAKNSLPPVPTVTLNPIGQTGTINLKITQSIAVFGQNGPLRTDPDWYATFVMMDILGNGGFSSWLTQRVREDKGLAYAIQAGPTPLSQTGLIIGEVGTRSERMDESLQIIKQQWQKMRDQGPTTAELDQAKAYINGSFPLMLTSTTAMANLLVTLQMYHLGLDYLDRRAALVNKVTLADIHQAAQKYLDVDGLHIVRVNPSP